MSNTLDQKEELAKKLLSKDIITYRDIVELCNLTVSRVLEIKNIIKEKRLQTKRTVPESEGAGM